MDRCDIQSWIGCTNVGPGCDHCYAEDLSARYFRVSWGDEAQRRRTGEGTWKTPHKWNRARKAGEIKAPKWVFCASLADVFDNKVPLEWRTDLFRLIEECPALHWQICTKRLPNVRKMILDREWFIRNPHVGLLITVVTQGEAERDIPRLIELKRAFGIKWVGLSIEPQLEPIELRDEWLRDLDWVIVGGESGFQARPFDLAWARSLIAQCTQANVPVFMKQVGRNAWEGNKRLVTRHLLGGEPEEWPADLHVRQMLRVYDHEA
jgi:protein gp37